MKRVQYIK